MSSFDQLRQAVRENIQAVFAQFDFDIPLERLKTVSRIVEQTFARHGDAKDLPDLIRSEIDAHFNSGDRNSDRYWFHSTTVERFADIAMATLKNLKLSQNPRECVWWTVQLPH